MSRIPDVELNDGASIPQLGFGVFQIHPDDTAEAVQDRAGHRLPPHRHRRDVPEREAVSGQGIRDAGIDRGDVFITSKLNNGLHEPDDARRAFDETLAELGFDYVDLFLIHWPLPTLLRRRLRLHLAHARGVRGRRPGTQHRGVQLPGRPPASGWPPTPTPCPRSTRSRCTRTSSTTTSAPTGPKRHRHRGVVADRPGQGARRPGGDAHRGRRRAEPPPRWCCAGTSSAATSCSRNR